MFVLRLFRTFARPSVRAQLANPILKASISLQGIQGRSGALLLPNRGCIGYPLSTPSLSCKLDVQRSGWRLATRALAAIEFSCCSVGLSLATSTPCNLFRTLQLHGNNASIDLSTREVEQNSEQAENPHACKGTLRLRPRPNACWMRDYNTKARSPCG